MLKIPNLGRVTLNEIKDLLKEYGLRFGMSKEDISVWETSNQIFRPQMVYIGNPPYYFTVNPYTREVIDQSNIGFSDIDKCERIDTKLYLKKEHYNVL